VTDAEAVKLLLDLVSTPSVTGSESQAVDLLVDAMTAHGLNARRDPAGNAVGMTGNGRGLMFLGHVDTVPGLVPVRQDNGCIYGRGAVDAKGPLAAAVAAACRVGASANVTVVGAVGEEGGSEGARFLRRAPSPPALVIGEPGGSDSVVLGYRGSVRAVIHFAQDCSHSAGPTPGICDRAFEAWGRVLHCCAGFAQGHDTFRSVGASIVGFSSDGDGLQESADLRVAFRIPTGVNLTELQDGVRQAARPGSIDFAEAEPPYEARKDSPLVAAFLRALRAEGVRPRLKHKTGTSDMNVVAPTWGCPTVAYGPGDSKLDHTPQEHIRVAEYLQSVRVLTTVFAESARCM